jgi:hypothetical protein
MRSFCLMRFSLLCWPEMPTCCRHRWIWLVAFTGCNSRSGLLTFHAWFVFPCQNHVIPSLHMPLFWRVHRFRFVVAVDEINANRTGEHLYFPNRLLRFYLWIIKYLKLSTDAFFCAPRWIVFSFVLCWFLCLDLMHGVTMELVADSVKWFAMALLYARCLLHPSHPTSPSHAAHTNFPMGYLSFAFPQGHTWVSSTRCSTSLGYVNECTMFGWLTCGGIDWRFCIGYYRSVPLPTHIPPPHSHTKQITRLKRRNQTCSGRHCFCAFATILLSIYRSVHVM